MYLKKQLPLLVGSIIILFGVGAEPSHAQVNDEAAVRAYFADIPVMIEIARCESKFRQFTDSGNVLRGGLGGNMIGVFQFNEPAHRAAATTLGHDLTTLDGNLAYARHLYEQEGTQPWNSARACFESTSATTPSTTATTPAADQTKIALLRQVVTLLQTLLALRLS